MQLKKLSLTLSACVIALSLCSSSYADESRLQRIKDNEELRVSVNNNLEILSLSIPSAIILCPPSNSDLYISSTQASLS